MVESIRNELAQKTYNDVLEKLKEHKKCMLIRPTGFGKTYLLAHLTNKFKRVLYLYPIDIIRLDVNNKYKEIINKNTDFLSYRGLINAYKADKNNLVELAKKYDLIICDEAHMAGATETIKALKYLMEIAKNKYFVGATATPDRSDGFDVTGEIFNDITLSDYTLHDAIENGLIPKPYYVYSLYEIAGAMDDLVKEVKKIKDKSKREDALNNLRAIEVEMGNLINAPKVIKETINKVLGKLSYMKFMVFFSEKDTLRLKKDKVEAWFRDAYPNMKIRGITITSDLEYAKNINKLDDLKYKENTIDLIYCIDMLNMGYHIDDITGIIMLRGTSSNIIYKQQVGRCLSVASDKTPIIFDLVNNIFRKPYYGAGEKQIDKGINRVELVTRGNRINDLTIRDLIIDNKTATYNQIINKIQYEISHMRLEEAIDLYTNKSAPMTAVVKITKLREEYIRNEFKKRGIKLED